MNLSRQIFGILSVLEFTDKDPIYGGGVFRYTRFGDRFVSFISKLFYEGLSVDLVLEGSELDGVGHFVG